MITQVNFRFFIINGTIINIASTNAPSNNITILPKLFAKSHAESNTAKPLFITATYSFQLFSVYHTAKYFTMNFIDLYCLTMLSANLYNLTIT